MLMWYQIEVNDLSLVWIAVRARECSQARQDSGQAPRKVQLLNTAPGLVRLSKTDDYKEIRTLEFEWVQSPEQSASV
jgi:hypothetical protein